MAWNCAAASYVTDLRRAIGINDKFLMIRDLFGGDAAAYEAAIGTLNGFDDFDECMIYIAENYAWNANSDGAKFLMELLERRWFPALVQAVPMRRFFVSRGFTPEKAGRSNLQSLAADRGTRWYSTNRPTGWGEMPRTVRQKFSDRNTKCPSRRLTEVQTQTMRGTVAEVLEHFR